MSRSFVRRPRRPRRMATRNPISLPSTPARALAIGMRDCAGMIVFPVGWSAVRAAAEAYRTMALGRTAEPLIQRFVEAVDSYIENWQPEKDGVWQEDVIVPHVHRAAHPELYEAEAKAAASRDETFTVEDKTFPVAMDEDSAIAFLRFHEDDDVIAAAKALEPFIGEYTAAQAITPLPNFGILSGDGLKKSGIVLKQPIEDIVLEMDDNLHFGGGGRSITIIGERVTQEDGRLVAVFAVVGLADRTYSLYPLEKNSPFARDLLRTAIQLGLWRLDSFDEKGVDVWDWSGDVRFAYPEPYVNPEAREFITGEVYELMAAVQCAEYSFSGQHDNVQFDLTLPLPQTNAVIGKSLLTLSMRGPGKPEVIKVELAGKIVYGDVSTVTFHSRSSRVDATVKLTLSNPTAQTPDVLQAEIYNYTTDRKISVGPAPAKRKLVEKAVIAPWLESVLREEARKLLAQASESPEGPYSLVQANMDRVPNQITAPCQKQWKEVSDRMKAIDLGFDVRQFETYLTQQKIQPELVQEWLAEAEDLPKGSNYVDVDNFQRAGLAYCLQPFTIQYDTVVPTSARSECRSAFLAWQGYRKVSVDYPVYTRLAAALGQIGAMSVQTVGEGQKAREVSGPLRVAEEFLRVKLGGLPPGDMGVDFGTPIVTLAGQSQVSARLSLNLMIRQLKNTLAKIEQSLNGQISPNMMRRMAKAMASALSGQGFNIPAINIKPLREKYPNGLNIAIYVGKNKVPEQNRFLLSVRGPYMGDTGFVNWVPSLTFATDPSCTIVLPDADLIGFLLGQRTADEVLGMRVRAAAARSPLTETDEAKDLAAKEKEVALFKKEQEKYAAFGDKTDERRVAVDRELAEFEAKAKKNPTTDVQQALYLLSSITPALVLKSMAEASVEEPVLFSGFDPDTMPVKTEFVVPARYRVDLQEYGDEALGLEDLLEQAKNGTIKLTNPKLRAKIGDNIKYVAASMKEGNEPIVVFKLSMEAATPEWTRYKLVRLQPRDGWRVLRGARTRAEIAADMAHLADRRVQESNESINAQKVLAGGASRDTYRSPMGLLNPFIQLVEKINRFPIAESFGSIAQPDPDAPDYFLPMLGEVSYFGDNDVLRSLAVRAVGHRRDIHGEKSKQADSKGRRRHDYSEMSIEDSAKRFPSLTLLAYLSTLQPEVLAAMGNTTLASLVERLKRKGDIGGVGMALSMQTMAGAEDRDEMYAIERAVDREVNMKVSQRRDRIPLVPKPKDPAARSLQEVVFTIYGWLDERARAVMQRRAARTNPPGDPKREKFNIAWNKGENAVLSNLAPRRFTYEGKVYGSVEHAYQTLKSGKFDGATYNRPRDFIGQKVNAPKRVDRQNSFELMAKLIEASIEQNADAKNALLDSGDKLITHNIGTKPDFWTKGFPRILMQVRAKLRGEAGEETEEKELERWNMQKLANLRTGFPGEYGVFWQSKPLSRTEIAVIVEKIRREAPEPQPFGPHETAGAFYRPVTFSVDSQTTERVLKARPETVLYIGSWSQAQRAKLSPGDVGAFGSDDQEIYVRSRGAITFRDLLQDLGGTKDEALTRFAELEGTMLSKLPDPEVITLKGLIDAQPRPEVRRWMMGVGRMYVFDLGQDVRGVVNFPEMRNTMEYFDSEAALRMWLAKESGLDELTQIWMLEEAGDPDAGSSIVYGVDNPAAMENARRQKSQKKKKKMLVFPFKIVGSMIINRRVVANSGLRIPKGYELEARSDYSLMLTDIPVPTAGSSNTPSLSRLMNPYSASEGPYGLYVQMLTGRNVLRLSEYMTKVNIVPRVVQGKKEFYFIPQMRAAASNRTANVFGYDMLLRSPMFRQKLIARLHANEKRDEEDRRPPEQEAYYAYVGALSDGLTARRASREPSEIAGGRRAVAGERVGKRSRGKMRFSAQGSQLVAPDRDVGFFVTDKPVQFNDFYSWVSGLLDEEGVSGVRIGTSSVRGFSPEAAKIIELTLSDKSKQTILANVQEAEEGEPYEVLIPPQPSLEGLSEGATVYTKIEGEPIRIVVRETTQGRDGKPRIKVEFYAVMELPGTTVEPYEMWTTDRIQELMREYNIEAEPDDAASQLEALLAVREKLSKGYVYKAHPGLIEQQIDEKMTLHPGARVTILSGYHEGETAFVKTVGDTVRLEGYDEEFHPDDLELDMTKAEQLAFGQEFSRSIAKNNRGVRPPRRPRRERRSRRNPMSDEDLTIVKGWAQEDDPEPDESEAAYKAIERARGESNPSSWEVTSETVNELFPREGGKSSMWRPDERLNVLKRKDLVASLYPENLERALDQVNRTLGQEVTLAQLRDAMTEGSEPLFGNSNFATAFMGLLKQQSGLSLQEIRQILRSQAKGRESKRTVPASSTMMRMYRVARLKNYTPPQAVMDAAGEDVLLWLSPPKDRTPRVMTYKRASHVDADLIAQSDPAGLATLMARALRSVLYWIAENPKRRSRIKVYVGRVGDDFLYVAWKPGDPMTMEAVARNLAEGTSKSEGAKDEGLFVKVKLSDAAKKRDQEAWAAASLRQAPPPPMAEEPQQATEAEEEIDLETLD